MKAVIIGGGNFSEKEKLSEAVKSADKVICADRGYDYALSAGIVPDIVIGDMDSVKSRDIKAQTIVYPEKKDFTDSELCMEYAKKNGYTDLVMFGFIGTRMDHTCANLTLLTEHQDVNAVIIDNNNEIYALKKENTIYGKKNDIVSIIPLAGDILGITTENLEYPLNDEALYFGKARGVSNVMTDVFCKINVKSGKGLVIKSRD